MGALVAGVQFKLDGVNLGAEDTVAPYSVPWDTTTTPNGAHTLTAVARDALGLQFTSDPVTVTVFNDTTLPTVSITSPTSGATVAGTVTVSATASDNVGVVGVQFSVDGAPLGAEDTVAPYSVPWDTTTTPDGPHTLTAVARDARGNRATSAPVTVTVSSAPPPPPPETATRFEETNPSITYTAGWTQGDTSRTWSGGTAAFSTAASAQATFTFTGTSVSWIGFRGPQTGIARVFLDGAFVAEVDTFSSTEEVQAVVFGATGPAAESHTLTIEVTGLKNAASTSTFIVVDAFDVTPSSPPPTVTRFEESAATFRPPEAWFEATSATAHVTLSGDRAMASFVAGATATFTFTGTGVSWLGAFCESCGIARVFLDGALVATIDTFDPTRSAAAMFTTSGLPAGSHTLVIEVTGDKNPSSRNPHIGVDAFDVTS